jgi:uncharacterized membrane protein YgcG
VEIVLGVSMTPTAVQMVLVEGENADGVTVDRNSVDITGGPATLGAGPAEQVIAAILGTRESAAESGHHLKSIGVAWTDHAAAARLSQILRAHGIDDVVLVSELHAASALAQTIGQAIGYASIALLFLERATATLAVVRTVDGAVIRVDSRSLNTVGAVAELRQMVAGLRTATDPPDAVFMVGSGVDIAALRPEIAASTNLPVHAPDEGELALARGAALASAAAPRFEASTVGLAPGLLPAEDTQAAFGATQLAAAGYMAPLGYSAVPDEQDDLPGFEPEFTAGNPDEQDPVNPDDTTDSERKPFMLVGTALSTVFVVGVAALAISLAVVVRPAVEQRPDPGGNVVMPTGQSPAAGPGEAVAPETIQAPIPVVQQAPRTVFVAPGAPAPPVPAPVGAPAPAPAPVAAPAPAPALPPAPVTVTAAPAAPIIPPIVVPLPIVPPLLTSIFQPPAISAPALSYPATTQTAPSAPSTTTSPPTTQQAAESPSTAPSPASETAPSTSSETAQASSSASSSAPSATSSQAPSGGSDSTAPSVDSGSGGLASTGSSAGGSGASESPLVTVSPSG